MVVPCNQFNLRIFLVRLYIILFGELINFFPNKGHNTTSVSQSSIFQKNRKKKGKEKTKKSKLKKEDIGHPTDFQHITHVGWDPNTGFDVSNKFGL